MVDVNPHLRIAPVLAGVPSAQARVVGVLVHGRDQDEQVMLDVVHRLALPDAGYVLPVAAGSTWYPGRYFDPVATNQPEVDHALAAIEAAIAVPARAGVPDERIVIAGFSQGACLIAELAARRPRRWAGVAVLTGTLLGPRGERAAPAPGIAGTAMFFGSSRYDEWIDPVDAEGTAHAFAAAGARVTLKVDDDRTHHINNGAVAGLRRLLAP